MAINLDAQTGQEILLLDPVGGLSVISFQNEEVQVQRTKVNIGRNFTKILLKDLNKDGYPDLVSGIRGKRSGKLISGHPCGTDLNAGNGVPVYLGSAKHSFDLQKPCPLLETNSGKDDRYVSGLDAADFNQDGALDIVLSRTGNYGKNYLAVLSGDGKGGFSDPLLIDHARPAQVIAADYNNDGKADILVSNAKQNGQLLLGDGEGHFKQGMSFKTLDFHRLGHFNNDSFPDMVSIGRHTGKMLLYFGSKDGFLPDPIELNSGLRRIADFLVIDLDDDGNLDLLFINGRTPGIRVLLGQESSGFKQNVEVIPSKGIPLLFASADFNQDGTNDLFTLSILDKRRVAAIMYQDSPLKIKSK